MTMLTAGMRTAAKTADAADTQVERSAELRIAQRLLGSRLAEAYALGIRRRGERPTLEFAGDPTALDFVSIAPAEIGLGGLSRVRIAEERGGGTNDLVFVQQRVMATAAGVQPAAAPERRVLLHDVQRVRLRYFGQIDDEREARWHDAWRDSEFLPMMIELDVEFAPGDRRSWPTILAVPVSTAGLDCLYETGTRRCGRR